MAIEERILQVHGNRNCEMQSNRICDVLAEPATSSCASPEAQRAPGESLPASPAGRTSVVAAIAGHRLAWEETAGASGVTTPTARQLSPMMSIRAGHLKEYGAWVSRLGLSCEPLPESASIGLFERHYRQVGVWHGEYGSADALRREWDFWRSTGRVGVAWLIGRLREETDVQVLNGTAELLAEAGPPAAAMILRELGNSPAPYQAYALLLAWGWGRMALPPAQQAIVERILRRYLIHSNSDVREAAAVAARSLPGETARRLLRQAMTCERDPAVQETLAAELAKR